MCVSCSSSRTSNRTETHVDLVAVVLSAHRAQRMLKTSLLVAVFHLVHFILQLFQPLLQTRG